jgi:hypothetical protein
VSSGAPDRRLSSIPRMAALSLATSAPESRVRDSSRHAALNQGVSGQQKRARAVGRSAPCRFQRVRADHRLGPIQPRNRRAAICSRLGALYQGGFSVMESPRGDCREPGLTPRMAAFSARYARSALSLVTSESAGADFPLLPPLEPGGFTSRPPAGADSNERSLTPRMAALSLATSASAVAGRSFAFSLVPGGLTRNPSAVADRDLSLTPRMAAFSAFVRLRRCCSGGCRARHAGAHRADGPAGGAGRPSRPRAPP